MSVKRSSALVAPISIGPANAEHVIGHSWRWCRDTARRLGVPILHVGTKPLIRVAELVPALEHEAAKLRCSAPAPQELTEEQEIERLRTKLGVELIAPLSAEREQEISERVDAMLRKAGYQ